MQTVAKLTDEEVKQIGINHYCSGGFNVADICLELIELRKEVVELRGFFEMNTSGCGLDDEADR